jgi:hypothetical protein
VVIILEKMDYATSVTVAVDVVNAIVKVKFNKIT